MSEQSDQPDSDETPKVTDESSVYARGQTVIPKMIRDALAIEYGTKLHWEVREGAIHVMPIPKKPVQALRGILKGTGFTWEKFMAERKAERELELEREKRLLS
jgi:AbrB family looped-hinge helix DNA binding protein